MKKFTKILKIITIIVVVLFVLISTVPYFIPLPDIETSISKEELVSENGKFISIAEKQLYYEEYKPKQFSETIIFIHGFGGNTFSWRNNKEFFFNEGYRVILLDLLGYGLSDKDYTSDYSHTKHAERLNEFMNALDIRKAHLVGHSMGASVVTHFAYHFPEKVNKIILVDGAVFTHDQYSHPTLPKFLISYPPIRRIFRLLIRFLLNYDSSKEILKSVYHDEKIVTDEVFLGYADRNAIGDWDLALLASTRDSSRNNIRFPLSEIVADVLVISGEFDSLISLEHSKSLSESFSYAKFEMIPNVGHLSMEERPDIFNQQVLNFLIQKDTIYIAEKINHT
jgi:pimeloyl-ACP methyl ester carboxylesterase